MIIWGIKSGIQNSDHQLYSLGHELKGKFDVKEISLYSCWSSFFSFLNFLPGIFVKSGGQLLVPPWPDVILNAHPSTDGVAHLVKQSSQGKSLLVHLHQSPKPLWGIDVLVVPEGEEIQRPNVINTQGYLNEIKPEILVKDNYAYTFNHLPSPQILVVGEIRKGFTSLSANDQRKVISGLIGFQKKVGGALVFSPFLDPTGHLKKEIEKITGRKILVYKSKIPLSGALAWADVVVCVGGNMMMLSQACSSGREVRLCTIDSLSSQKFKAFAQRLYSLHIIRDLESDKPFLPYKPLREAERVASLIRQLHHHKNKVNVVF